MMFELPEVETVRRELDRDLVGKKAKTVEAASMAVLRRYKNRKAFTGQLDDMKITGVGRRGLHLLIVLDGDSTLVVDLGSSGSLRRNANKDKVDANGETPSFFAVLPYSSGQCLQVLLDAGADMSIRNNDGFTVLDIAKRNGNDAAVAMLTAAAADQE